MPCVCLETNAEWLLDRSRCVNGFLFESNLPPRTAFASAFPIIHATTLGVSPTDSEIWKYAREHDLAIVSKDADFSERIIISTPPPRVIHLRFGNMRLHDYRAFLASIWPRVEYLVATHKLVNVYRDRIECVN